MDKEARGKLGEIVASIMEATDEYRLTGHFPADTDWIKEIDKIYKKLGYRRLPKDKPPLLSDGEIGGLDYTYDFKWPFTSRDVDNHHNRVIAQAQREADIKFYNEGK